jgi:hypothetical protein
LEKPGLATFAESKASQFKHQEHVDVIFWILGYYSSGVCSSRSAENVQNNCGTRFSLFTITVCGMHSFVGAF